MLVFMLRWMFPSRIGVRRRASNLALTAVALLAVQSTKAQIGRPIARFSVDNVAPTVREEIVRASVPFRRGAYKDLSNVTVRGVDTAWMPLTTWPDGSIQWAQAQFFATLEASKVTEYEVTVGPSEPPDRLTLAAPWLLSPILLGAVRTEVEDIYGTVYDTGLELDRTAGKNGVVVSTPRLVTYRLRSYHRPKNPNATGIGRDFLSLTAYLTFFHFCAHAEMTLILGNDYRGADQPLDEKDPNNFPLGDVRFKRFSLMIRGKELAFIPRFVRENKLHAPRPIRNDDGEDIGWQQDLIGPGKGIYLGDGCSKVFEIVLFAPLGNPRIPSTNDDEQRRRESAHALAGAPLFPMVHVDDLRRSMAVNAHGGPAPRTRSARAKAVHSYENWLDRDHFGVFGKWGEIASTRQTGTPRNTPIALHAAYRAEHRGLMKRAFGISLQQALRPYHLFGLKVGADQDIYLEGLPLRRGSRWVSRETLGRSKLPEVTSAHRKDLLLPYSGPHGFNAFDYEHFSVDVLYETYCMTGSPWIRDELAMLGEQLKGMLRPAVYYFSTARTTRGEGWCMKALALCHRATRDPSLKRLAIERIPILLSAQKESGAAVAQAPDARALGDGVRYDAPWQQAAYVMGMLAAYDEFEDERFATLALDVCRIMATDGWENGRGPKYYYAIGNPSHFKGGVGTGCQEFSSPALILAAELAEKLDRIADRDLFLARAQELWDLHRRAGIEKLASNKWWQIHLDRFPGGRVID